jgi:hypothetical protein
MAISFIGRQLHWVVGRRLYEAMARAIASLDQRRPSASVRPHERSSGCVPVRYARNVTAEHAVLVSPTQPTRDTAFVEMGWMVTAYEAAHATLEDADL